MRRARSEALLPPALRGGAHVGRVGRPTLAVNGPPLLAHGHGRDRPRPDHQLHHCCCRRHPGIPGPTGHFAAATDIISAFVPTGRFAVAVAAVFAAVSCRLLPLAPDILFTRDVFRQIRVVQELLVHCFVMNWPRFIFDMFFVNVSAKAHPCHCFREYIARLS